MGVLQVTLFGLAFGVFFAVLARCGIDAKGFRHRKVSWLDAATRGVVIWIVASVALVVGTR
jgi:hypothetical protein